MNAKQYNCSWFSSFPFPIFLTFLIHIDNTYMFTSLLHIKQHTNQRPIWEKTTEPMQERPMWPWPAQWTHHHLVGSTSGTEAIKPLNLWQHMMFSSSLMKKSVSHREPSTGAEEEEDSRFTTQSTAIQSVLTWLIWIHAYELDQGCSNVVYLI